MDLVQGQEGFADNLCEVDILLSLQTPPNTSPSKIFCDLDVVPFIGHLCSKVCRKRYSEEATSFQPRFDCGIQIEDCQRENYVGI